MILRQLGSPTLFGRSWSRLTVAALLVLGGGGTTSAGTVDALAPSGPEIAGIDHDFHDHITISTTVGTTTPTCQNKLEVSYSYSSHHEWEITSATLQRFLADPPPGTPNGPVALDTWGATDDTTVELDRGPIEDCVELSVEYRYEVRATFGVHRDPSRDPGPATLNARYHIQPQPPSGLMYEAPTATRSTAVLRWDTPVEGIATGYGEVLGYVVQYRIDDGSWVDSSRSHSDTSTQYADSTAWKLPGTKLEYRVRQRTALTDIAPDDASVWTAALEAIDRTASAPPTLTVTAPQAVIQLADASFPPPRLEWGAPTGVTVKYQVYRRPIDGSNSPFSVRATEINDAYFVEDQARTGDTYEYQVRAYSYDTGGGPLSTAIRLTFVGSPRAPATVSATAAQVIGLFGSAFRIEGPSALTPGRLHEFEISMTSGQARLGGRQRGVVFNAGESNLARWVDADNLGACAGVLFCPVRPEGTDYGFHPADGRPSQWLAYWRGIDTATGFGPDESIHVFVAPDVSTMHSIEFGFGQLLASGTPEWFTDDRNQPTKQSLMIQPVALVTPHSLTARLVNDGRVQLAWMASTGTYEGFQVQRRPVGSGDDAYELVCCRLAPGTQAILDTPPAATPGAAASYEYRVGTFHADGYESWFDATARVDLVNTTAAVEPWPRFADADRNPAPLQFTVGATVDQALPAAMGGDAPLTYQFTDLSAIGLRFDTTAHKLVGTAAAGTVHGTLSVRDADGDRDELWYEITVGTPPSSPRGLSASGGVQAITLTWISPATTGSAMLSGYRVQHSPDGTAGTWRVLVAQATANAVSYTHANLSGGQTVHYRVAAISPVGIGTYSDAVSATTDAATAPPAPTSFLATPDFREVVLRWTPPERDGGSPITGYRLEWSATGAGDDWQQLRAREPASARTYTVSNLWGGRLMHFRIAALNDAGTSPYIVAQAAPWAPTRPSTPTALIATPDVQRIVLRWTAPVDDGNDPIRGYRIQQSANGLAGSWMNLRVDTHNAATTYTHDGLGVPQTVHYRVAAINFAGISDFSDPVHATTLTAGVPGTPAGIDAIPYTESIRVEWGAPERNGGTEITEYRLQHSATGGAPWTEVRVVASADHYIHTGLAAGQRMYFRVAAVNVHGVGAWTRTADQRALNGQPTFAEAPRIRRFMTTDDTTILSYDWPIAMVPYPSRAIWEYSFDRWSGWREYHNTPAVGGAGTITKVTNARIAFRPGEMTYFRFYYWNRTGRGPWITIYHSDTDPKAPEAPTSLRGWRGFRAVDLAWDVPFDNGAEITGYQVEHSTDGTNWTQLNTGPAVPEYTVAGLMDGTEYQFRVAAINAEGTGGNSNELRISTVPAGTLPDPPAQLRVAVGVGQVTLSWEPPLVTRGATIMGYRIEHSADGPDGSWSALVTNAPATARTHSHTNLPSATEWHYRMFSLTVGGESVASAPVRAATTPSAPQAVTAFGGRDSVLLEWSPPAEFLGPPVESYRVQYGSGDSWRDAAPDTGSGETRRLLARNQIAGLNRRYRVVAVNAVGPGNDSPSLTVAVSPQRPTPPRDLAALMHGDDVEVRWLAPASPGDTRDRIVGYRVDRLVDRGTSWTTLATNTDDPRTSYVDDDVAPGTDATYRVFAINWRTHGMSLPSDPATIEVTSSPALAPTDVRVSFGFDTSRVRWDVVPATGGVAVTGYRVEHAASSDATEWNLLSMVDSATTTEATHPDLPEQTSIYYRVAAVTAQGLGQFSVPVGGLVRTMAVVLDLDGSGELGSDDALILYYALALHDILGDGDGTSGFVEMRAALLRNVRTATGPNVLSDAGYRSYLAAANELTRHSERTVFDVNQDDVITEDDALIMFYATSFGDLLNDPVDGERFRRTFLGPSAGVNDPSDPMLLELLTRANTLFGI